MGGSTQTSTSSTAPSNPMVTTTANKLLGGITSAYDKGYAGNPTYPGIGQTTKNAWDTSLSSAYNPSYNAGVGGAIDSYAATARGDNLGGQDEYFQRNLDRTLSDTKADVNSAFGADGRYGSNLHVQSLTDALGGVRDRAYTTELEAARGRQTQAAGMLPSLYGAAQLPGSTMGQIGAQQDDAQTALLARLSSIINGTASTQGSTTSTTSPSTPWWQSLAGLGIALL